MMTAERLEERGRSLWHFERLGGDFERLVALGRKVRAATRTDWPGRPPGTAEPRAPRGWCTGCGRERCAALGCPS
jgi:hypothetical protein